MTMRNHKFNLNLKFWGVIIWGIILLSLPLLFWYWKYPANEKVFRTRCFFLVAMGTMKKRLLLNKTVKERESDHWLKHTDQNNKYEDTCLNNSSDKKNNIFTRLATRSTHKMFFQKLQSYPSHKNSLKAGSREETMWVSLWVSNCKQGMKMTQLEIIRLRAEGGAYAPKTKKIILPPTLRIEKNNPCVKG